MKQKYWVFLLALLVIVIPAGSVFAYDDNTAHPALTQEIIEFYNRSFPDRPLTPQEKEWVITGSMLEDTAPRWINHFYDPVNQSGWTGEKMGSLSASTAQLLARIGVSSEKPLSAVEWVNAYGTQESYAPYGGNRSWNRGLEYFADGDKKNAYISLGHALHLLEDMTVPDHTRNDSHVQALEGVTGDPGSPYELYTTKWTRDTIGALHIPQSLIEAGVVPISKTTIADYLITTAEYSNHYFFSKDTINDPKYALPRITREDDNFAYGLDEQGKEFPLVYIDLKRNEDKKLEVIHSLKNESTYFSILDSYFSHLSKKAVQMGAGVIDLWKRKADDAAVNKEFPDHLVVFDPQVSRSLHLPAFSLVSELGKFANMMGAAFGNTLQSFANIFASAHYYMVGTVLASVPFAPTSTLGTLPMAPAITLEVFAPKPKGLALSLSKGKVAGVTDVAVMPLPVVTLAVATTSPVTILPPTIPFFDPIAFAGGGGSRGGGGGSSGGGSVPPPPVVPAPIPAATSTPTSTIASITHFVSSFDAPTMRINLSWDAFTPLGTATSSLDYTLYWIDGSSTSTIRKTSSTSDSLAIGQVGVTYVFGLDATQDGARVATATSSVVAKSFLDSVAFYKDPRASAPNGYLVDLRYQGIPFIPPTFSMSTIGTTSWQGIVFYLNHPANANNNYLAMATAWQPADTSGVLPLDGNDLSYRFAVNPAFVSTVGQGLMRSSLLYSEDNVTTLALASVADGFSFSPSDYLTLAYYDFSHSHDQALSLVAIDGTKYYFRGDSPQLPPTTPTNLSFVFDSAPMKLGITWATSTDPDTMDAGITYQLNVSTSSILSDDGWRTADELGEIGVKNTARISLAFPNSYTVGIRAVDNFGNMSAPVIADWHFPEDFHPIVPLVGIFSRDQFPNGNCGYGMEPIVPTADMKLARVTFYAECAEGRCDIPNDFRIYDATGSTLLTYSDGWQPFGYPEPIQVNDIFSGDNQIVLRAGTTYLVTPFSSAGRCVLNVYQNPQKTFTIEGIAP